MVFTDFFQHIEWNICNDPNTAINTTTNSQLTNEELDSIFEIKTITDKNVELACLMFPMGVYNNYCDNNPPFITKNIEIPNQFTLRQLLTIIYNFYQEPLLSDESITTQDPRIHIPLEYMKEIQQLRKNIINAYDPTYDESKLKNINVFTEITLPKFCGISYGEYTYEYWIQIKI